jgi:hypothetical protein
LSNPLETAVERQARKDAWLDAWLDEQATREREDAAWAATADVRALTTALSCGWSGEAPIASGEVLEVPVRVTVPMYFYSHRRLITAAKTLPNGLIIPGGSYIRPGRVSCGFCNRDVDDCKCTGRLPDLGPNEQRVGTNAIVRESKHIDVVEAAERTPAEVTEAVRNLLDGNRPLMGACYICAGPKHVSYPHKGRGVRYCLPCAEASLRDTI